MKQLQKQDNWKRKHEAEEELKKQERRKIDIENEKKALETKDGQDEISKLELKNKKKQYKNDLRERRNELLKEQKELRLQERFEREINKDDEIKKKIYQNALIAAKNNTLMKLHLEKQKAIEERNELNAQLTANQDVRKQEDYKKLVASVEENKMLTELVKQENESAIKYLNEVERTEQQRDVRNSDNYKMLTLQHKYNEIMAEEIKKRTDAEASAATAAQELIATRQARAKPYINNLTAKNIDLMTKTKALKIMTDLAEENNKLAVEANRSKASLVAENNANELKTTLENYKTILNAAKTNNENAKALSDLTRALGLRFRNVPGLQDEMNDDLQILNQAVTTLTTAANTTSQSLSSEIQKGFSDIVNAMNNIGNTTRDGQGLAIGIDDIYNALADNSFVDLKSMQDLAAEGGRIGTTSQGHRLSPKQQAPLGGVFIPPYSSPTLSEQPPRQQQPPKQENALAELFKEPEQQQAPPQQQQPQQPQQQQVQQQAPKKEFSPQELMRMPYNVPQPQQPQQPQQQQVKKKKK